MWTLVGVGLVAGLVTAISPCVLPVLPVVFAAGTTGSRRRCVAIVAGLAVTFGLATLFGELVLSALHLPQDLLYDVGIALLLLLALGLVVDPLGALLERPFSRLRTSPRVGAQTSSGFVLGAGLGLVFAPCAGAILTAITVAGNTHRVSWSALALAISYSVGVAVPLLALALASERIATTWSFTRAHARGVRRGAGVLIGAFAIFTATGAATSIASDVPGYVSSIENTLVSPSVQAQLSRIDGEGVNRFQRAEASLPPEDLADLGHAPQFAGITEWLNTPGGRPLTLRSLRDKVVLVDFWTYSCINCRRSLPHVEAWYREYHKDGLVVVGVHTPEFPFEYVASNVIAAARSLGVTYPIAIDDAYGTWNAYHNNSWPAEYLIDENGEVRHTSVGEGDYGQMESDIRALLSARGATDLPPPTDVPDRTPNESITEESYLGWYRLQNADNPEVYRNQLATYYLPSSLPADLLAFGGQWRSDEYDAVAGSHAVLELSYQADDVYLVLGGTGTVRVSLDGHVTEVLRVAGYPDLYTILAGRSYSQGLLTLDVSRGVRAYDFTFG